MVVAELVRLYGTALAHTVPAEPHPSAPPPRPAPAQVDLGRYRVVRPLGAGAMGAVYEAWDPELDRRVAVKLLHRDPTTDGASLRSRLLREAQAMAKLSHPHVVTVYDVGDVGDQIFVAMELIEGMTLTDWRKAGQRSQREILDVFVQAAQGLDAAHKVGLVHRDFKPDNVMIGVDGRARVTDFGLARPVFAIPVSEGNQPGMHHTRAGTMVGTPAYMAPEQFRCEPATALSDQFAFCVALHESLTHSRPFAGARVGELARNVLQGIRSPSPVKLPRWLDQVLRRGLAAQPEQRFPSMDELVIELTRDRGRWTRRLAYGGVVVAGAALGAVGLAQLGAWSSMSEHASAPSFGAAPGSLSVCPLPPDSLDEEFNAERKDKLFDSLRTHDILDGDGLADASRLRLEAFASDWGDATRTACGGEPSQQRDASLRCLRAQRTEFEGLVRALSSTSSSSLAPQVAHGLPDPQQCLSERPPAPPAPAAGTAEAARVELLRQEVATAQGKAALGHLREANSELEQTLEAAERLGHDALTAEVVLALGQVAMRQGRYLAATTTLEDARALALASEHHEVGLRAAVALFELHGVGRLDDSEAKRWQSAVDAELERRDDPRWIALRMTIEAERLVALGHFEDALETLDDHGDEGLAALAETSPVRIEGELVRASAHVGLMQWDEAIAAARRAKAAAERARLGFWAGRADLVLASIDAQTMGRGSTKRWADARHAVSWASNIEDPLSSAIGYEAEALGLILLGELEDAEKAAVEVGRRRDGTSTAYQALLVGAELSLAKGDAAGAQRFAEQAVEFLDVPVEPGLRIVEALRMLSRAQAASNDMAEADATLDRAYDIVMDRVGYKPLAGFIAVERAALAERDGDPERQLKHLDDAYVPLHTAYGGEHPRMFQLNLDRADLAWDLGRVDYAKRLYGSLADRAERHRGPDHPDVKRIEERL